jgi:hypothetical protein
MSFWRDSGRDFLNYSKFIHPIGIFAVLVTVLGVGWYTQPDRLVRGYQPEQPLPYSHQLHAGILRIDCLYCHTVTKVDSPDIKLLAAIYDSGDPLQWQRIHELPDHVYFDHRPHVNAGILCQTCHGEVQTMQVVYQNMSMRMGNCLGCHRNPDYALPADSQISKGAEHCCACHR